MTFVLAVSSIVLSFATFVLREWFSMAELYPFFSWKLYTQPVCGSCYNSDYRVYGISGDGDTVRLANKGYPAFTREDYNGYLHGEAGRIEAFRADLLKAKSFDSGAVKDLSTAYFKRRLTAFGDALTGDAFDTYLLVEERFIPLNIKNEDGFEVRILLAATPADAADF